MPGIDNSDYSDARKLDLICDEFEDEIRVGRSPLLEDYVPRAKAHLQSALLCELLQIEFSSLWENGKELDTGDYVERFPEFRETVLAACDQFLSEPTHASRLKSGEELGKYQIRGVIGEGAHATVYRAFDNVLHREVALKVLHDDLPEELADLFLREARTAAQLKSRGFCQIYDTGEVRSRRFISMQLVEGKSLKQLMRERPVWKLGEAVALVYQIAVLLQRAHQQGIYHLDLKPANLLIDSLGELFIADFGLAHRDPLSGGELLPTGAAGSPAYMAPELFDEHSASSPAAQDVFSLGVVLHELVLGRRPSRDERGNVTVDAHALPRRLDSILRRTLANDVRARYTSMAELVADLQQFEQNSWPQKALVGAGVFLLIAALGLVWKSPLPWQLNSTTKIAEAIAESPVPKFSEMNIGVVRRMPGQEDLLWLLESSFESIYPKREMDISFGVAGQARYLAAGRWDDSSQSLPATIEVLNGYYRWHLGLKPERFVDFGREDDFPLVADWTGDGLDELISVRRGRGDTVDDQDGLWHWIVRDIAERVPSVDLSFMTARDGDKPVAGVWSQTSPLARPAIARPNTETKLYDWYFYDKAEEPTCSFGSIDGQPIVADFDGDGITDLAVVEPGVSELVWSFDLNRDGEEDGQHAFGLHGDTPVVGVWRYPQVRVTQDHGDAIYPTSVVAFGDADEQLIHVENSGTSTLMMGTVTVVCGGFKVVQEMSKRELAPGESTTFRVAHAHGESDGVITFSTNDPNERDFRFVVQRADRASPNIQSIFRPETILTEEAITVKGLNPNALFGQCISASEETLAVGAPGVIRDGEPAGAAFAFRIREDGFELTNDLHSQPASNLGFGHAIDIYHDTIVVGAPQNDGDGYACLFHKPRDGGQWRFVGRLQAELAPDHKFGSSVAVWADTIVVGSFADTFRDNRRNVQNRLAGSVHLFRRDLGRVDGWGFQQTLFSPLELAGERFGYSVDVDRECLVVGSIASAEFPNSGTYVFHRQVAGPSGWGMPSRLNHPRGKGDAETTDLVCIRGPMVGLGGLADTTTSTTTSTTTNAISMYYRDLQAPDKWLPSPIQSPLDAADYRFGSAMAISDDGLSLLAAARALNSQLPGRVYLFARASIGSADWQVVREIHPTQYQASATFGATLAFLRDAILVGDPKLNRVLAFRAR